MPRRAAPSGSSIRSLSERVAALEERVARLECGRPPPGDGRTTRSVAPGDTKTRRKGAGVKRCPGCGLPLRRRQGRCAECGRPLDA